MAKSNSGIPWQIWIAGAGFVSGLVCIVYSLMLDADDPEEKEDKKWWMTAGIWIIVLGFVIPVLFTPTGTGTNDPVVGMLIINSIPGIVGSSGESSGDLIGVISE